MAVAKREMIPDSPRKSPRKYTIYPFSKIRLVYFM